MMQKVAQVQDPELNKAKASVDAKAGELMHLDWDAVRESAEKLADSIDGDSPRVLVTGGAGSGKSTLAECLEQALKVRKLNFDEYVPGGWTSDSEEYARRFNKGLYELWEHVPQKKGWVIEHVEACHPDLVGLYPPDYAILVDPGEERLRSSAEARTAVMGADSKDQGRLARALQSDKKAKAQFNALKGEVVLKMPGFILKKVEG